MRLKKRTYGWLIFILIIGSAGLRCLSVLAPVDAQPAVRWNNKVYVAFGFHGNLYHSFRGDTNDENGFGKDIRIIRHILATLDRFNDQGVPVRASWEFDNHFSLEHLLPKYAPDIIKNVKRRVAQGRDEVMLMSYNNGLASAMTRQEFTDAVNWSISNPWGSGVKDVFGSYSPIVRPQEMMTTPGNFEIYKQSGVKAVSLYYSATPFDTFRVFSRKLTREEAHNPLTYKNDQTGEEILVIPTYNIGDLVENVSLGQWVRNLHRMQHQGEIRRDVLVFINFDADSEFWTGADRLKWPLNRLPNTRGLEGLIKEVQDLNYVRFTTVNDYLADHGPAGTVSFSQDTADGSFDGYNSWSEKRAATDHWTRIVEARRIHSTAEKCISLLRNPDFESRLRPLMDKAYLLRLTALSTTNFGMATPYVAPQRRQAMEKSLNQMDRLGDQIEAAIHHAVQKKLVTSPVPAGHKVLENLLLIGSATDHAPPLGNRFVILGEKRAKGTAGKRLYLTAQNNRTYPLILVPGTTDGRFYISGDHPAPDGLYTLTQGPGPGGLDKALKVSKSQAVTMLKNRNITLEFDRTGALSDLIWNGRQMLASGSLMPYIRYGGMKKSPGTLTADTAQNDRTAVVKMTGEWTGPEDRTLSMGSVNYTFSLVEDLPYLFVQGEVRYPATVNTDLIKADVQRLSVPTDLEWQEVAPLELRLEAGATKRQPIRILKHNYLGINSAYDLDYFRHSEENLDLDNVNNHITAGYVGVAAGNQGVALSMDQAVAANFAGAPVKVKYDRKKDEFNAEINPFGSYHGKQNRRPTWGNGQGHEASLISGEQYHSAAPTYNGTTSRFALMIGFFDGDHIPEQMKHMLDTHANPARIYGMNSLSGVTENKAAAPVTYKASIDGDRVTFSWEKNNPDATGYILRIGSQPGRYTQAFKTKETRLTLGGLSADTPFEVGQRYYAVIETIISGQDTPVRTDEFSLDIRSSNRISAQAKIPWRFPLKVIWANVMAFWGV
nr:hypothetical protein [uncultured Desulfobacter sp.]